MTTFQTVAEPEGFVSSPLGCFVACVKDGLVLVAMGSSRPGGGAMSPNDAERFADIIRAAASEARAAADGGGLP